MGLCSNIDAYAEAISFWLTITSLSVMHVKEFGIDAVFAVGSFILEMKMEFLKNYRREKPVNQEIVLKTGGNDRNKQDKHYKNVVRNLKKNKRRNCYEKYRRSL